MRSVSHGRNSSILSAAASARQLIAVAWLELPPRHSWTVAGFAPFPNQCPAGRSTDLTSGFMARESSRLSWCPTLARALDADYQVECCSGDGLIMTDGDVCRSIGGSSICLPALQPRRLMCDAEVGASIPRHCPGLGGDATISAATDGAPDAIVINLGQVRSHTQEHLVCWF